MPIQAIPDIPGVHSRFIQSRLPDWLLHGSQDDFDHLGSALLPRQQTDDAWFASAPTGERQQLLADQARCRRSAAALAKALAALQGIGAFCEPLLRARIESELGVVLEVNSVEFVQFELEPVIRGLVQRTVPRQQTLMQAALQNFSAQFVPHAQAALAPKGGLVKERMLATGSEEPHWGYRFQAQLAVDPARFTRLCHTLDLGGQYQRHLAEVFEAPASAEQVRACGMALYKDRLRVCVQTAFLQQEISAAARQALLGLLHDQRSAQFNGKPLCVSQLRIFKAPLADVLVFSADRLQSEVLEPVIVYWPGAPQPLIEYASVQAAQEALRRQLRLPAYQRLLRRYLAQADQQHVFTRLEQALYRQVSDGRGGKQRLARQNSRLYLREVPVDSELFGLLQTSHLHKLKADARWLAVPSAEVDEIARKERFAYWQGIAFDVLNAAAFFVPGLGEVMALVAATQLVQEVVAGVEDWEQGDLSEAWQHLAGVGLNLAAVAGLGLAQRAVVRMSRSPVLDGLIRVRQADGRQRLWQPALAPYAVDLDLTGVAPDAQGIYRVGANAYLRLDGHTCELMEEAGGQWRLGHPHDSDVYQPSLRHNREGIWHVQGEQPSTWSRQRLLRRLGPLSEGLEDEVLDAAARISGTDEALLRHTHLTRSPLPPLLKDTLRRLQIGRQVERAQLDEPARAALFAQLYRAACPTAAADVQRLQRMFTQLSVEAAQEVLGQASRLEREELAQGLRGPSLRVAEEARRYQQQLRLNRALEGLYQPTLASADSERLAQALLAQATEVHQPAARAAFNLAIADRAGAARALGQQPIRPWFRTPLRLADGRLGYPMGGVLAGESPLRWRLNELYPEITQEGMQTLLLNLKDTDLETAVRHLEMEYEVLEDALQRWFEEGDLFEMDARRTALLRLKAAWRRTGGAHWRCLDLSGLEVGLLPILSARFSHIRELRLDNMQLNRGLDSFLGQFVNLRELSLASNRLERLPSALAELAELQTLNLEDNPLRGGATLLEPLRSLRRLHGLRLRRNGLLELPPSALALLSELPALSTLDLHGNFIALDGAQLELLSRLPLQVLDLSANRIRLDQRGAEAFSRCLHLRQLNLSFNPLRQAPQLGTLGWLQTLQLHQCALGEWPPGLTTLLQQNQYQLRFVDLSSNHIVVLPELAQTRFGLDLRSGAQPSLALHLGANPLDAASIARLEAVGLTLQHDTIAPGIPGRWLDGASGAQRNLWNALFSETENRGLKDMIERMLLSREYQQQPSDVSRRIWTLLGEAREHTALREQLLEIADSYPATCGDAGTDAFSELEIALLSFRRSQEAIDQRARQSSLLALYRQLFRRAEVQRLADRLALRRSLRRRALLDSQPPPALDPLDAISDAALLRHRVDDIEIRLALRQQLAIPLNYPEPSRGMLYGDLAGMSERILSQVDGAVRAADTAANRQAWMAANPTWQQYLKQRFGGQFEVISAFWLSGLDYLDYCLGSSTEAVARLDPSVLELLSRSLNEPLRDAHGRLRKLELDNRRYLDAVQALREAHAQAENSLLLSLTHAQSLAG